MDTFNALTEVNAVSCVEYLLTFEEFFTQENIDILIQFAIEQKAYEIQLMLTDYKYQHFDTFGKDLKL